MISIVIPIKQKNKKIMKWKEDGLWTSFFSGKDYIYNLMET
jgi:hypothetical protein